MYSYRKYKLLAVLMVAAMLVALLPAAAGAADTGTDKYKSDETTMIIAGNVEPDPGYPYPAVPANAGTHYGVNTWINQTGSNSWDPAPTWIWESMPVVNPVDGDIVWFEKSFEVIGSPTGGSLKIACDNGYAVWLNGKFVGKSATLPQFVGADFTLTEDYDYFEVLLGDLKQANVTTSGWQTVGTYDLAPYLLEGDNVLTILGVNEYMYTDDANDPVGTTLLNPGGLAFSFTVDWEKTAPTYDFCGYKYLGDTDEGLEGWTIELYKDDVKIGETTTDENGRYCFTDLPAGTYVVKEVLQPGWTQIYPVPNEHTVVLPLPSDPMLAPYGGSRVVDVSQGLRYDYTAVRAQRSNPDAALTFTTGQNEANFFSLGFQEDRDEFLPDDTAWIIIEFDTPIMNGPGDDLRIIEDTWGLPYPDETTDIWVSQDGTSWVYLGEADNQNPYMSYHTITDFDLEDVGLDYARFVKVQDTSNRADFASRYPSQAETLDGFDLNAVVALQDYEPPTYDFRNEEDLERVCETAWGHGEGATPNNEVKTVDEVYNPSNAWGWTNWFDGEELVLDLYAGAGQNVLDKGTKVGTVTVTCDGGEATVVFQVDEGYSIDEAHLWIGDTMLPLRPQGRFGTLTPTSAPGQFKDYVEYESIVYDPDESTVTFVIAVDDCEFWVAAHAVVCWYE